MTDRLSGKLVAVVCLISSCTLVCESRRHVVIPDDNFLLQKPPLTITAFNVQVLGVTKLSDARVMDVVKQVILQSDISVILEIRDSSATVPTELHKLVNGSTHHYDMVVSGRLGRTSNKEQYAFFYRTDKIQLKDTYQYPDPNDYFERAPFLARFKALTSDTLDNFGVLAVHTSPSDAANETSRLVDVYDAIQKHYQGGLENVLIGGDFNADCNYVDADDWPNVKLRHDPRFTWRTPDSLDTTVSGTKCAYDRFVSAGGALRDAYIPETSGLIRFDIEYNLTYDEARDVSDHYPIILQLAGTANSKIQKTLSTQSEFTVQSKTPVANVNYIREIYRQALESASGDLTFDGFTIEVLKKRSGGMVYVTATKTGLPCVDIMPTLERFRGAHPKVIEQLVVDGMRAHIWANIMRSPYVYGLNTVDQDLYDVIIHCRLRDPFLCKVTVVLHTSN